MTLGIITYSLFCQLEFFDLEIWKLIIIQQVPIQLLSI